MIKFFRIIRQNLLLEGKTGRYLKYAIGEIVLVVIGILIALQINNWNEDRIKEKRIVGYIKSMIEDIESDLIYFDQDIRNFEQKIKECEYLITSEGYKQLEVDSIAKLVRPLYLINRTTSQTYEKLKNEGFIESLGSNGTNKAVNDYYNTQIIHYQGLIMEDKEESLKSFDYWYYNSTYEASTYGNDNTSTKPFLTSASSRKTQIIKLIESIEGRNHIRGNLIRKTKCLRSAKLIQQKAIALKKMLNQELETR